MIADIQTQSRDLAVLEQIIPEETYSISGAQLRATVETMAKSNAMLAECLADIRELREQLARADSVGSEILGRMEGAEAYIDKLLCSPEFYEAETASPEPVKASQIN